MALTEQISQKSQKQMRPELSGRIRGSFYFRAIFFRTTSPVSSVLVFLQILHLRTVT